MLYQKACFRCAACPVLREKHEELCTENMMVMMKGIQFALK